MKEKTNRGRAWRRKQSFRVARKHYNIAQTKCSGSHCRDEARNNKSKKELSLYENKFDLTCDCKKCIVNRVCGEIDYDKFERDQKREIEREYREEFCFIT